MPDRAFAVTPFFSPVAGPASSAAATETNATGGAVTASAAMMATKLIATHSKSDDRKTIFAASNQERKEALTTIPNLEPFECERNISFLAEWFARLAARFRNSILGRRTSI